MNYFYPDVYQKSIYTINYDKLKENGIKCLLFDLDNTCVPYIDRTPTKKLKNLFLSTILRIYVFMLKITKNNYCFFLNKMHNISLYPTN